MARRYHIKCIECGKVGVFGDVKDIIQSKWKILAWNVKSGDPKALCDKCEYKSIESK